MKAQTFKTKYIGIHLQSENELWWIVDDNGGEKYFGPNRPSKHDIDVYRETTQ